MIQFESTTVEIAKRNVLNRRMLKNKVEEFIRQSFDNAATTLEAESWITIAVEQGFKDMAAEMKADLQTELTPV